MKTTHHGHQHDDDDEGELRRQLGPLRDLHHQHTESAVVNMSVRVHAALQQPRRPLLRGLTVSIALGLATVITIVVVLNPGTSNPEGQRVIVSTTTDTSSSNTAKQDVRVQSTPKMRATASAAQSNSPAVRPRNMTNSQVVLLRDSEMLRAVNEANEDALVDRILEQETEDDFAILDLTSADVDAVLP